MRSTKQEPVRCVAPLVARWVRCALVALVLGASTIATVFVPLTIEQLTAQAQVVVHGRVEAIETARDTRGSVFTGIDVRVVDVWKGRLNGGGFRIVRGGGVLGDIEVSVDGQAEYAPGDEVVVFLVRNDAGEWTTLGLGQGRFGVTRNAPGEEPQVHSRFWGRGAAGRTAMSTHDVARGDSLPLAGLKRRVRELVR